jgi:predicted AAA+ superfamily ATPase
VRLLLGARQTGKTALLRELLQGNDASLWDLQDSRLRLRLEADPSAFSRAVRALPAETATVVVDEIQKVPALLEEVQHLHDAQPGRWEFFLTGSSARRLRAGSANLLPGRSHVYALFPVNAWEVEGERASGWPFSPPAGSCASPKFPAQPLERLLTLGSLPGIRSEPAATAALTLEAYVANYLEEEIRREALARDLGAFSVFLQLAAVESGRVLNISGLSVESGVPATTLKNYYGVLVDTLVGTFLRPYSRPGRKALLTSPRFLFFDVGVRNAAAGLPLTGQMVATEGGPLLEQWATLELCARASWLGRSHRVSFWKTRSGAEVDIVYESPEEDVPIEVKWTSSPRPGDARHVETFLDAYPDRARRGIVLCRVDRPQQLTDRVVALPWDSL